MSKAAKLWAGAGALALPLAATPLLLDADRDHAFLLGHRIDLVCGMKQLLGIPCPACGLTRSVVLTLHGRLGDALAVNPAGSLLVLGLVVLAAALAVRAWSARRRDSNPSARLATVFRCGSLAYAAVLVAVLLMHWVAVLWQ